MKAYVSPARYYALRKDLDAAQAGFGRTDSRMSAFMGMQLCTSNAFPARMVCAMCNGSGEGVSSTYCQPCRGAGATIIEGYIEQAFGPRTLLVAHLPRRFAPSFPAGLVPPRNPVRIVA